MAGEVAEGRVRAAWRPERARVVANARRGRDWYKLTLEAPHTAAAARPGHFVALRVHPAGHVGLDPLLRRPFSLCEIRPGAQEITLVYRVGGRGTQALAAAAPGQELDLLGPLGRSFPDPGRFAAGVGASAPPPLFLVGGGVGIPPLVAAAHWAVAAGREVRAVVGARSADELAAVDELRATGVPVDVATDDGSAGRRGLVTDLLAGALRERGAGSGLAGDAGAPVAEIWACGPEPMLVAVERLAAEAGALAYLSVERPMACGFGVCMACAIPRADGAGYLHVCVDGPVVRAGEVRLGHGA